MSSRDKHSAGSGFRKHLTAKLKLWRSLTRYEIEGNSMAPTLKPGDWILVEQVKSLSQFSASELGDFLANLIGEIVVIEQGGREQIKRLKSLAKRSDGSIWLEVLGDNPEFSTDSRHFGLIEASALKGIFYRRYGKRKEKRVARIK